MVKNKVLQIKLSEETYNKFQKLADKHADGNISKYGRKLIKKVIEHSERSNR